MNFQEFSGKIKEKYPQYKDIDDRELAQKIVAKYPQYSDVTFDQSPNWKGVVGQALKSASPVLTTKKFFQTDPATMQKVGGEALPIVGTALGGPLGGAVGELGRQITGAALAPETVPQSGLGRFASVFAQGAGPAIGEKVISSAPSLAKTAGRRALGFTKRFLNKPEALEKANQVAETMLQKGVIRPFSGTESMLGRAEALSESAGRQMGRAYRGIQRSGVRSFVPNEVASEVERRLTPRLSGNVFDADRKAVQDISSSIRALDDGSGRVRFSEAEALKRRFQDIADFESEPKSAKQQIYRQASGIVREAIDRTVKSAEEFKALVPAGTTERFKAGKQVYGAAEQAKKALLNRLSSEAGNRFLTPTDILVALPEAASGNIGKAAATVGLKEMLERPGTSAIASGAYKLGKASPQAGRFAGSTVAAVLNELRRRMGI